jgi:CheY-like chemotaxis protein
MTKRVLVIDDEFEILFVLQKVFEDFAGWQTLATSSSVEGLVTASREPLDAVILDVSMPEIDGFEFVERLQADTTLADLPIVLLTAKVTPSDQQRFATLNIAGVVAKPFDPLTVWKQVANVLGWPA